ncbi:MAG: NAD(P)/FAD-dependent oxidoreductase [Bacillaceae bacterium]|nr:NAD(P)/FAD-dependent oxidoreductase [Bacillaceae bacterium]
MKVDVAIVGGGIAGLSCALYTAQAELNTVVLDTGKSQLKPISMVYNYPGFDEGISGEELLSKMKKQADRFNASRIEEEVVKVEKEGGVFKVRTDNSEIEARYLVIASNLDTRPLEDMNLPVEVNPLVPSGKIKQVPGLPWNGATEIENLYVAGLLAGLPTQSIIAAGQGAAVGMAIVSKEKGKPHVWHDK